VWFIEGVPLPLSFRKETPPQEGSFPAIRLVETFKETSKIGPFACNTGDKGTLFDSGIQGLNRAPSSQRMNCDSSVNLRVREWVQYAHVWRISSSWPYAHTPAALLLPFAFVAPLSLYFSSGMLPIKCTITLCDYTLNECDCLSLPSLTRYVTVMGARIKIVKCR